MKSIVIAPEVLSARNVPDTLVFASKVPVIDLPEKSVFNKELSLGVSVTFPDIELVVLKV